MSLESSTVRHRLVLFAVLSIMLPVAGAWAAQFRHDGPAFVPVHNCTCRFRGEDIKLGERRCLRTSQGSRMAECVMEQNVTSWRPGLEACPEALRFTPRG